MREVSLDATVSRAPDVVAVHVGEVMVLHDPRHDRYVRLNDSGELLWNMLSSPRPVSVLSEALAARYGLPPDRVRADVDRLLADLLARAMLELG